MSDSPSGVVLTPERPWLGLRAFTEATRSYFFGRDAEIADLYQRVVHRPLTICYGQSGQGKTSLMNAGLVPRLRETAWLPVPVRIAWGDDDPDVETQVLTELRKALRAVPLPKWQPLADFPDNVSLWELLHDPRHRLVHGSPEASPWRLVFLFDQFEEIFTLGEKHRDRADAWRDTLGDLVENRLPAGVRARLQRDTTLLDRFDLRAFHIRFVLTLRHDYLHALERWRRYVPSLLDNRFELKALNGNQAFEAVVYPGRLRSSDPIVDAATGTAIVRFVASAPPETPLVEIEAVPPLLSLICSELNAQRLALNGSHIYFDPFFGEPPALRHFIENIPTNADGLREPIARSVAERELVGRGLTQEQVQESLDRLIDKGLLQPEGEGESERLHLSAELMQFAGRGGTEILQAFYSGCFTGLPGAVRLWVEDTLLSPEGFRQTLNYDTALAGVRNVLTSPADAQGALDQLISSRLLIAEEHGAIRRVELTHDILAPIVRESRERRKQVEARERAQPDVSQLRGSRAGRSRTRRSSADRLWDQLFHSLDRRVIVPVIGSKALVVEPDGQTYESLLAQQLALEMGMTFATEVPHSLDALMLAARRRDVDRSQINRAMRHAVRELEGTARSRTARELATTNAWDTFVLASSDSLIEASLRELQVQHVVLDLTSEASNELGLLHVPDATKLVYLTGRAGISQRVPCTTGETLEFWLNVDDHASRIVEWLRSSLKDRTLLFLGIDWTNQSSQLLPRLLRGHTRGFGLASFVDAIRAESVTDVMLLDPEGATEWVDQPLVPFIEELAHRAREIVRSTARVPMPVPSAPSEPILSGPAKEPAAPAPRFTVFVSYAREDLQAAERIVRTLQELGLDVWFDREQLVAGDSFIQSIRKAVDQCSLFVSLISRATTQRAEALFRNERVLAAERAERSERRVFYIPVVVDDTEFPFKGEPAYVNQLQYVRAPEGRLPESSIPMFTALANDARRARRRE